MGLFTDIFTALKTVFVSEEIITSSNVFSVPLPDSPDNALSVVITSWKRHDNLTVLFNITIEYRDTLSSYDKDKDPLTAVMDKANTINDLLLHDQDDSNLGPRFFDNKLMVFTPRSDIEVFLDEKHRAYCQLNYKVKSIETR
jgi:hypothetical protein